MLFTEKIKSFFTGKKTLDADFFDSLADLLIEGDFGALDAEKTVSALEEKCKKEKAPSPGAAKNLLKTVLNERLEPVYGSLSAEQKQCTLDSSKLNIILLLGVNGTGKTTTAAKLGVFYKERGMKPLFAACDTFRAAAIDQLRIHGENTALRVVAHKQNADAGAVLFDALNSARSKTYNPVIADTAGRMHTKTALVEELKKIDRVVIRFAGELPINYLKYLVLDSTTGSNALSQAEVFNEALKLDGVILTKTDSAAKGGVVFSLASRFRLRVLFLCSGESYTDIKLFDAASFVDGFLNER